MRMLQGAGPKMMYTKVDLRITRYINDDIKLAASISTTIIPKARDRIWDALVLIQRIYRYVS